MDRALYVGMSGAMQTLRAQAANNHNLANASTVGFRAELIASQSAAVTGAGLPTRVNAQSLDAGWDSSGGPVVQTGRELDVALRPGQWLAVQAPDGGEAYTKAGDLQVDVNGQLRTGSGLAVLGDGGPLSLPPSTQVSIGSDGTVTVIPQGQGASAPVVVGRLKVVGAQPQQLQRGVDGLFRPVADQKLEPAAGDVLTAGALEGANVNLADTMVTMIQLARQFELQTKLMHSADENAAASTSLLKMS